jgi:excisionase family DNA binding protein
LADEEYITVAQAAQLASLTTRHITRLLRRGTIPGVKPGRDWLVKPSAVMRYLELERRPGRKPRRTERPPLDK